MTTSRSLASLLLGLGYIFFLEGGKGRGQQYKLVTKCADFLFFSALPSRSFEKG